MKMLAILMMSAKLATLGFLEIKAFWKNGCDVILSVHDVTNRILSGNLHDIVDVVQSLATLAFLWENLS